MGETNEAYSSDRTYRRLELPVYQGKVYRNIAFDGFGDKEARDTYVAGHVIGEIVSYDAYTSSSTDINGYPIDGDFVVHHIIQSRGGKNLAGYGNNSESEVLFPRKSQYITEKIAYDADGTPTIYLTEVAYEQQGTGTQTTDRSGTQGNVSGNNSRKSRPRSHSTEESQVQRLSAQNTGNSEVQPTVSERNPERNSLQWQLQGVQAEVKSADKGKKQSKREQILHYEQEKTKYIRKVATDVMVKRIEAAVENGEMPEVARYSKEITTLFEKRIASLRKSEEDKRVMENTSRSNVIAARGVFCFVLIIKIHYALSCDL